MRLIKTIDISYLFKIFLFSVLLFPAISVWIAVVLIVIWLLHIDFPLLKHQIISNKMILILPILYLIYIVGIFYSQNISYALSKMETKLGMLIFPLMLSSFQKLHLKEKFESYQKFYINSNLVVSLFLILRSAALFSYELYCRKHNIILHEYPYTNYFFSSYLSAFMHYGYYAMYVNVGLLFLYNLFLEGHIKTKWFIICNIWLSVFVMMLYSKSGIFSMLLIHLFYILYMVFKLKWNLKYLIYSMLLFLALLFFLFKFIPYTKERVVLIKETFFNKKLDPNSFESTQLRTHAWIASLDLIKENFWTGYGTGDVNDVLMNKYKELGFTAALKKELNSHNQFFQTVLSVGFLGCSLLLSFFILYAYVGIKAHSPAMLLFSIISFIAFLFESYLETQAGVFYISILGFFVSAPKTAAN